MSFLRRLWALPALHVAITALLVAGFVAVATSAQAGSIYDTGNCIFCEFVAKFVSVFDRFAKDSFVKLAGPVNSVLQYVFALWIIMKGGMMAFGIGPGRDGGTMFWDIIKKSATYFVVAFMLGQGGQAWYWENLYEFPMAESLNIAQSIGSSSAFAGGNQAPCKTYSGGSAAGGGMSAGTLNAFTCLIERIDQVNTIGFKMGWAVIVNQKIEIWDGVALLKSILQGAAGVLILMIFASSLLYFTFFVMDLFFRIAFITALSPFFIGFFLMGPTRQYATRALTGVVQSCFTLIAASAIYGAAGSLLSLLPGMFSSSAEVQAVMKKTGVSVVNNLDDVLKVMDKGAPFSPIENYFWFLLICGLLTLAMTRKVSGMVQAIFGFNDGAFGMADKALSVATNSTKMAAGAATMMLGAAGYATMGPAAKAAMGAMGKSGGLGAMAGFAAMGPLGMPIGAAVGKGLGMGAGWAGGAAMGHISSLADRVNPMAFFKRGGGGP